jgi:hypothetical protein
MPPKDHRWLRSTGALRRKERAYACARRFNNYAGLEHCVSRWTTALVAEV